MKKFLLLILLFIGIVGYSSEGSDHMFIYNNQLEQ